MKFDNSPSSDHYDSINNYLNEKMALIKTKFQSRGMIQDAYNDLKERPSLIKINKNTKNFGYINTFIIEPFSSGEESDSEVKGASVKDVMNMMVDFNTIMTVKSLEDFPEEAKSALLFTNLDDWMSLSYVKQFIEEIPILVKEKVTPEIEKINTFKFKKLNCAIVKFKNSSQVELIFKYFNHPYKKSKLPTKNTKGESIGVFLTYDLLELTLSNWYAVILRNLPLNCSNEEIKSFCEGKVSSVFYALNPQKIKNSVCSVVVLRDLEEAEKLCNILNKKEQGKDRKIKAHLHPRSCKIRKNPEKSHFSKMLAKKDSFVFPEKMTKSASMILRSLTISKLHHEVYEKNKPDVKKSNAPGKIEPTPNIDKKLIENEHKKEAEKAVRQDTKNTIHSHKDNPNNYPVSLLNMLPKSSNSNVDNKNELKQADSTEKKEVTSSTENNTNISDFTIVKLPSENQTTLTDTTTNTEQISDAKTLFQNTSNSSSKSIVLSRLKCCLTVLQSNPISKQGTIKSKSSNIGLTSPNSQIKMEVEVSNSVINSIAQDTSLANGLIKAESESVLQALPELTEQEIEYFTYDFKLKSYYDTVKQTKLTIREEEKFVNRKRHTNFGKSFEESNIPHANEVHYNNIPSQSFGQQNYNRRSNQNNNLNNSRSYYNTNRQFSNQMNRNNYMPQQNPTIINNLSINMINPQVTHTNIVNNLIIQQPMTSSIVRNEVIKEAAKEEAIVPPKEELLPPLPTELPPEPKMEQEKREPGQILSDEDKQYNRVSLPKETEKRPRRSSSPSDERNKYIKRKRERSRSSDRSYEYDSKGRKHYDKSNKSERNHSRNSHRGNKHNDKFNRPRSSSSDSDKNDKKRKLHPTTNDFSTTERSTYHHSSYDRKYPRNYNDGNNFDGRRDKVYKYK